MRRGFTLVEMMVATVVAAMLLAGAMGVVSGLARDHRRISARVAQGDSRVLLEVLRRDLLSASAVLREVGGGVVLVGHGGVDGRTMTGTGRLARVRYRVSKGVLVREQRYLDDAIRPEGWGEVVMIGVRRFEVSGSGEAVRLGEEVGLRAGVSGSVSRVPARVRVRIEYEGGVIDEGLVLR
jgi:prepilin-type N-terminal cleavage/methylation domain-containing protein